MKRKYRTAKTGLLDRYFAFTEKRSIGDRILFYTALITVIASLFVVLVTASSKYLTSVPTSGGTLVSGIVGTPRFVNPVLAVTRADRDMSALVYSGLMKLDEHGALVPDLAQSVTLSPDGTTYHVILRPGITFQDETPVTAKDVAFTIGLIQNPDLKSPLRGNWNGVTVHVIDDQTLDIVLSQPYTPFIDNLTVGILPRARWENIPIEQIPFSQNNTEPIGTGPYTVSAALRSKTGLVTGYKLSAWHSHTPRPNITTLVFNFYQTETDLIKALQHGDIGATPSLSPENLNQVDTSKYQIIDTPLPRTFEIFLNQNKSTALRDLGVRQALSTAIDRSGLITAVLKGHGIPITGPVPPGFIAIQSTSTSSTTTTSNASSNTASSTDHISAAKQILQRDGWTQQSDGSWQKTIDQNTVTLSVTLATANTPLFEATADYVKQAWQQLGVQVNVNQFEQADLIQSLIRPRNYEALLFGTDIGRMIDLYPFWHSSQKDDPGLNIGQYTNITVDSLLSAARISTSSASTSADLNTVNSIITNEVPAIFLYTPTFSYVIDKDVFIPPLEHLGDPSDRFANIAAWHITSNKVWPVFTTVTK